MDLQQISNSITDTTKITVLTGAGISAPSGVPTFRGGADSLWENMRPEELATPQAFNADPEKVWRWYDWRRSLLEPCKPNRAHYALVELENIANNVTIITQNVDGLHQLAGSKNLMEFHGSIWVTRCLDCKKETVNRSVSLPIIPRCECGGMLRPGVVWFGEGIDPQIMQASVEASSDCNLFLVIGTSGLVHPAAGMAQIAKEAGATVVEFNLEPSGVSNHIDLFVAGSADETVPQLILE
jgi:NAD-dependent deacetylase